MAKEKNILTEEGRAKFEEELYHLKNVDRLQVTEEIKEARAQGDLSENADYDAAKKRQVEIENRIKYLEDLLLNATIIEENDVVESDDIVSLGATVELLSIDENVTDVYTIVGSVEADPLNGKISNECLLSKAIMGHRVGDEVTVKVDEPYSVRILKITK